MLSRHSHCEAGRLALHENTVWSNSKGTNSMWHGARGRAVTDNGSVLLRDWSQHRGQSQHERPVTVSQCQVLYSYPHTLSLGPTLGLLESLSPPGRFPRVPALWQSIPQQPQNNKTKQQTKHLLYTLLFFCFFLDIGRVLVVLPLL